MKRLFLLLLLLLLMGCSSSNSWMVDSIASGSPEFDSSRLVYSTPQSHLKLEFLKCKDSMTGYLFLTRHSFSGQEITFVFQTKESKFEEHAQIFEGGMRCKLSPESIAWLIASLQNGQEIAILGDGFQETVLSADFLAQYRRFQEGIFQWPISLKEGNLR